MPDQTIDPHEINASIERFLAHTVRGVVEEAERLGIADHPALTAIPNLRAYLRRYDDAAASLGPEDPQPVRHLRLVG